MRKIIQFIVIILISLFSISLNQENITYASENDLIQKDNNNTINYNLDNKNLNKYDLGKGLDLRGRQSTTEEDINNYINGDKLIKKEDLIYVVIGGYIYIYKQK